jgi:hypothetical protein
MMNLVEFVDLVRKMREAQKAYFKGRQQSNLIASKMLEATVDKALKELSQQPKNSSFTTCKGT